jgi:large subunit ribosomal protein L10
MMKENPRAVIVADFQERLEKAKVAIIAEYKGLTVKDLEGFRHDLRAKGAQLRIIKNTLAKRAIAAAELPDCEDVLKGQVAFVFGYEDAVGGPQAAKSFAKKHKEFKIIAGIFEGERVEAVVIEKLASLPTKDVMRAQLLMLLKSPQMRLLSLLRGVQQEFLGTLKALAVEKEKSTPEQDTATEDTEESTPEQDTATGDEEKSTPEQDTATGDEEKSTPEQDTATEDTEEPTPEQDTVSE